MDEFIQYVNIQYQTFPEILAQINSIFSLLMLLGVIARKFASGIISKEFYNLLQQNLYFSTKIKMSQLIEQNNSKQQKKYKQKNQKQQKQYLQESFNRSPNQKQEEVKLDISQLNLSDNQVEQNQSKNQSEIKDSYQVSFKNSKNQECQYQDYQITLNNSCQSQISRFCGKKTPQNGQQKQQNDSLHQNYLQSQAINKSGQQSFSINPQNQSNLNNVIQDQDQGETADQQFKQSLNLKYIIFFKDLNLFNLLKVLEEELSTSIWQI
ncbi:hypothetical protein ABPG74_016676 [Tetrahymena malaccensis]